ncbi:glycoside hydrolase family 5 protein [Muricoccus radiodurans]|uniref:glycoside hydrolase family 5 protein n=1 Tax=Muricoccus radiodurans TaxID=2231721 RepID=UPI003CE9ED87
MTRGPALPPHADPGKDTAPDRPAAMRRRELAGLAAAVTGASLLPPGPARAEGELWITAQGARLRDEAGRPVLLRSAAWYGFEARPWPSGLRQRSYRTRRITVDGRSFEQKGVLEDIRDLGFDSIRMSICQDIANPAWSVPPDSDRVDARYNPDFVDPRTGRPVPALTMLTRIAEHCRTLGLRMILDMHCAEANTSNVHGNTGLWYTTEFPDSPPGSPHFTGRSSGDPGGGPGRNEAQFFAAWKALAQHFRNNSAVCAFDLVNEPYWGVWESGAARPAHNLRSMYERLGNELHAINPNLFLWLEGPADAGFNPLTRRVELYYGTPRYESLTDLGQPHWGSGWSSNLRLAGGDPPRLRIPNKHGYSPHEYGVSSGLHVFNDRRRTSGGRTKPLAETLPLVWTEQWGYLADRDIAPIWIGEWAPTLDTPPGGVSRLVHPADRIWLETLGTYLRARHAGHSYYSLNADNGDNPRNGWFRGHDWIGWTATMPGRRELLAAMYR